MAQIREIRKRIKSIQNTSKGTHAMELVSAAKMRRAQSSALSGRPYSTSLSEMIEIVKKRSGQVDHPLLKENNEGKNLIVIISSDRGLAGGLNINVFREILREEPKDAIYITVGKKAADFATKSKNEVIASFGSEEMPPLDLAHTLSKLITDMFLESQIRQATFIYPEFVSTVKQSPKWVQLLPVEIEIETEKNVAANDNMLFEPSAPSILSSILPHFVLTKIYQILLEAKASEHSARMVAMKNATDAAGELIDDLTLTYNQARQEAITKELLDIVTAQRAFE